MNEQQYRVAEQRFWNEYGTSPTERWLELRRPATRIRVQEVGEGIPLLFLHGGPGAGTIFAPLASQLSDFRCILLDRPGCALSPPITYTPGRIDQTMAELVGSCLDALGVDRVGIVTSSFGGSCGLWFAQRYPDRLSCLVHMGCPAFLSQSRLTLMLRVLATPGLGYLAARLPMNRSGVIGFMKSMGQQRLIAAGRLPEAFIEWWKSLVRDTSTMRNERELVRSGLTWRGMRPELIITDEVVQAMAHPTYFYWGADDPFGPAHFATALVQGMPNARIDVIPGAGHLPWFDDASEAAARTRAFVQVEHRRALEPA